MQSASSANTHCILSGTLPDIINENRKTLRHIHHLRFSSSVSRSPRPPFRFTFPGGSLSSPPKIKLQRPSTSELSSLVCAFHDGDVDDDVSSTFCLFPPSPSGSMRAASSRFHGKRGRADVNCRMALSPVIYEDYFHSVLAALSQHWRISVV